MPISIATTYQNLGASGGADIDQAITVSSGTTLMACIGHDRDMPLSEVSWGGVSLNLWASYIYPSFGWRALSVYALQGFSTGLANFRATGGGFTKNASIMSWNGVNYLYNILSGLADPGGSAYISKDIIKTSTTDVGVMVCYTGSSELSSITGTQFCRYGNYLSGQHGAATGLSTTLVQYTTGAEINVTWITFALQEYIEPPPSELFSPMWIT